jgi:hypothetical protein
MLFATNLTQKQKTVGSSDTMKHKKRGYSGTATRDKLFPEET